MATRNLNQFIIANNARLNAEKSVVTAKKGMLLSLIEEIRPFVGELNDMYDTYQAVKAINETYATKVLWSYLQEEKFGIDMNSYFGVSKIKGCLSVVHVTRKGIAILYFGRQDMLKNQKYSGDNAKEIIENNDISEGLLDEYIKSVRHLIENFPKYEEGFFNLVENPKFPKQA